MLSSAVGGWPAETAVEDDRTQMAKRTRGTSRPGQRAPIQRTTRPTGSTSSAISQPAAPAEAGLVQVPAPANGDSPAAAAAAGAAATIDPASATGSAPDAPASATARGVPPSMRSAAPPTMAAVAATEYRYVTRDLRRIGVVGGSMFALLAVFYVAIEVFGIGR
jgi:hypothetical protein